MRECLIREAVYRTSRSSGPGGQHVNKTESRVELLWIPHETSCLNDDEKSRLISKLHTRLSDQGVLILGSEKHRSQHRNKKDVTERFIQLVTDCLVPVRKRQPTKPTGSSREKRIRDKKIRGEIKKQRKNLTGED